MTELSNDSIDRSPDAAAYAASLMHHYGFDFGGDTADSGTIALLLLAWQEQYPASWIRLATIEALYQGRYKAISVEQILALWQRRSQPVYHFNHEFERLICDRLPQPLTPPAPPIQEEPFSMRSAQAMIAHLPHQPLALPHASFKTTPPHHSDAMQALRTLQDATADRSLADDGAAESTTAPNEPSLAQTYSYIVRSGVLQSDTTRSDMSPSKLSTHEQSERVVQNPIDSSQAATLLPSDSATSLSVVSDETVQAELIAPTETRSDGPAPATNQPAEASLPTRSGTQAPARTPQAASIARILQQLDEHALDAKALFAGFGLLDQTLQPKLRLDLTARYQPIWLTDASSKQPIHQFTPIPEGSDFHTKLKSVAQAPEAVPDGEPYEQAP